MRKSIAIVAALFLVALFAQRASAHDTVYYYYTDTLHSAVMETDAQGNVVERTYYAPYGQVLNRPLRDGPGYTGHEEDPATGLNYMQQRYYDPQAGRFLSVDPVGVDPTAGGNFNRYWYANDNPYRYTDPDGRETGSTLQAIDRMTGGPPYVTGGTSTSQMLSAVGDALDTVNQNLAPLNGDTDGEFGAAMASAIGGIRTLAKVAKVAKVAEKAEEGGAAAKRAENIAKGIPEARLGPSGKPMVHTVEHSTRKAARESAEREAPTGGSTRFDAHPQDGQKPHFQAEDARGENVKPVVHHCVPNKSC